MESPQTLHDFVLNLLSNDDARAAFQLDPQGSLHAAGLSDVDASDVRDVIPLVVDYAPVPVLDGGLPGVPGLPGIPGLPGLPGVPGAGGSGGSGGLAGAVQQLQLVTQQLPPVSQLAGSDFTMAATGTVAGTTSGLTGLAGTLTGGGSLAGGGGALSGDLSAAGDVTHTLDAGAVADATNTVQNTVGSLGQPDLGQLASGQPGLSQPLGTVTGVADTTGHGLTGELSHLLGAGGPLDLSGAGGPLGLSGDAGGSAGVSGGGSVGTAMHADATAQGAAHADSPLQHGVVGDLLGGATSLLGAPDDHHVDVTHLF